MRDRAYDGRRPAWAGDPRGRATPVGGRPPWAGSSSRYAEPGGQVTVVRIDDIGRVAEALPGVRRGTVGGLAQWRYHGRLVARQLDDTSVVIRADFDYRALVVRQFPGTFRVPDRYRKHMMVVADLAGGDAGAIEEAIEAAWRLQ